MIGECAFCDLEKYVIVIYFDFFYDLYTEFQ